MCRRMGSGHTETSPRAPGNTETHSSKRLAALLTSHKALAVVVAAVMALAVTFLVGYLSPHSQLWLLVGSVVALGLGAALPARAFTNRVISAATTLVLTAVLWAGAVVVVAWACNCQS